MKNKNFLSFILLLIVLAVVAAFVVPRLYAQPYYTNSSPINGGGQYNDSLVPPTQPAATRAAQYRLGINTGTSVTSTDGTVTNSFATNYVYTVAPVVTVNQTGVTISSTNVVVSVTTTNFVYSASKSGVTNNWTAIGR